MAINTGNTKFFYSTDGTAYIEVCPIISYPDLGSSPSKLDTTDLSATKLKTSILGLQEAPDMTFEANYSKADYLRLSALTALYTLKIEFGASGADGKFIWSGHLQVFPTGSGVDEVRKMTVIASVESAIVAS